MFSRVDPLHQGLGRYPSHTAYPHGLTGPVIRLLPRFPFGRSATRGCRVFGLVALGLLLFGARSSIPIRGWAGWPPAGSARTERSTRPTASTASSSFSAMIICLGIEPRHSLKGKRTKCFRSTRPSSASTGSAGPSKVWATTWIYPGRASTMNPAWDSSSGTTIAGSETVSSTDGFRERNRGSCATTFSSTVSLFAER